MQDPRHHDEFFDTGDGASAQDLAIAFQLLCNKAENNKVHIRELQHDLQQQQQRTEAADTENRALREKASQWKAHLESEQTRARRLHAELEHLQSKADALQQDKARLMEQLAKQEAALQAKHEAATQAQDEVARIQQKLNQRGVELLVKQQEMAQLQEQLQDANKRLQAAETQREELWQLRQQLQDLTRSKKAQQLEAARLQQELREYQNRTQQQVQAQQEENDRLRQQMQDYDARAKQVLQEQQIENDRLREQLTEYEARAKQVVQEQKEEAGRLQQQLQDYETRAKQVVQEQKQENERLREEMAQYQGLAKEFVRQRHDMAHMQEQLQIERQRAHNLENAAEVMRAKYKRLLQRVAALNAPSSGGAPFEGGSITGAGNSAWDLQAEMDNMLSRTGSCRSLSQPVAPGSLSASLAGAAAAATSPKAGFNKQPDGPQSFALGAWADKGTMYGKEIAALSTLQPTDRISKYELSPGRAGRHSATAYSARSSLTEFDSAAAGGPAAAAGRYSAADYEGSGQQQQQRRASPANQDTTEAYWSLRSFLEVSDRISSNSSSRNATKVAMQTEHRAGDTLTTVTRPASADLESTWVQQYRAQQGAVTRVTPMRHSTRELWATDGLESVRENDSRDAAEFEFRSAASSANGSAAISYQEARTSQRTIAEHNDDSSSCAGSDRGDHRGSTGSAASSKKWTLAAAGGLLARQESNNSRGSVTPAVNRKGVVLQQYGSGQSHSSKAQSRYADPLLKVSEDSAAGSMMIFRPRVRNVSNDSASTAYTSASTMRRRSKLANLFTKMWGGGS